MAPQSFQERNSYQTKGFIRVGGAATRERAESHLAAAEGGSIYFLHPCNILC